MPWTTVFGNVFLPLKLAGADKAAAAPRIMETLARVGLADFADAYPRELSGGMRMRVSIARALVTAPRILLMDEPFAALDEITRFKLNDDLIALWRELRMTVVFVTHSVFESVLSLQPHRGDDQRGRAGCRASLRSTRPIRATRTSAPRRNTRAIAALASEALAPRHARAELRHERAGMSERAARCASLRAGRRARARRAAVGPGRPASTASRPTSCRRRAWC